MFAEVSEIAKATRIYRISPPAQTYRGIFKSTFVEITYARGDIWEENPVVILRNNYILAGSLLDLNMV